jgi:hypothetical protein
MYIINDTTKFNIDMLKAIRFVFKSEILYEIAVDIINIPIKGINNNSINNMFFYLFC